MRGRAAARMSVLAVLAAAGQQLVAHPPGGQQVDVVGDGGLTGQRVPLALEQCDHLVEGGVGVACEGFEQGRVGGLVHLQESQRVANAAESRPWRARSEAVIATCSYSPPQLPAIVR